jgi:creatinine amidohydrolase
MTTLLLEEMTWPEIRDALESGMRTVIIPVASIEQHGYHLAQLTDALLGTHAALALAERWPGTLVAPVIRPGLSAHHMDMPGSLTLRPETFRMMVEDIVACYIRHGFTWIILMAAHGGNIESLNQLAEAMDTQYPQTWIIALPEVPTNTELEMLTRELDLPQGVNGGHADDRETSEMLFLAPQHVRMDKARPGFTGQVTPDKRRELFEQGIMTLSETGVVGDPTQATAERGKWYIEKTTSRLEQALKEIIRRKQDRH